MFCSLGYERCLTKSWLEEKVLHYLEFDCSSPFSCWKLERGEVIRWLDISYLSRDSGTSTRCRWLRACFWTTFRLQVKEEIKIICSTNVNKCWFTLEVGCCWVIKRRHAKLLKPSVQRSYWSIEILARCALCNDDFRVSAKVIGGEGLYWFDSCLAI